MSFTGAHQESGAFTCLRFKIIANKDIFMNKICLLLTGLLLASHALAFDKTYESSLADMEDLVIKSNGVKLNNFTFGEEKAFLARGLSNIKVSFSARNKNAESKHFSTMFVGKSGETTLWAISAEPSFSSISGNETETISADAYITPATLKKTKTVWIRVVGDI